MKTFPLCILLNIVSFLSLTAQKKLAPFLSHSDSGLTIDLSPKALVKDNKIVLQWECRGYEKNTFCIIERSLDQLNFDMIGIIKTTGAQAAFEFTDERASKEKTYYRIKMTGSRGEDVFSQTISVDRPGNFLCRFYPNPVNKVLIVRTEFHVGLQITDLDNKIRINQQLQPGLQIVDVSSLEKGIYILSILRNNNKTVLIEKLIKN